MKVLLTTQTPKRGRMIEDDVWFLGCFGHFAVQAGEEKALLVGPACSSVHFHQDLIRI